MIAAVVLTFDAPDGMLDECLRALRACEPGDLRVIVVDNGQGTRNLPTHVRDSVEIIETGRNLGYAGGMNVGIARSLEIGVDAIALLNDDVVVQPGWLGPLRAELDRDPTIGAVQPKLVYPGLPRRVNSLGVLLGRDGAGIDIGIGELDESGAIDATDIELFTGGAALVRSQFLRRVGTFDKRFFMYYEDVDLGLRGREMGWRYRCVPASVVEHRGGATVAHAGTRAVYWRERNRLWILLRYRPVGDIARGTWLSIRRLRWPPRGAHLQALVAGWLAAPRLLARRWAAPRR